eukprot:g2634.t1
MDGEAAPTLIQVDGRSTRADAGSSDERVMFPLKRGRFSASPATGLIGLQENEFLGDFFGCLGFLSLASERACVAMAVVHNFLDDQVKNHEYCTRANSIVDALPPEEIPRGFRELLQYTGFAWAIETEHTSVEDTNDYWENLPPIWELSESVVEQDVCGFVLAVTLRVNQPFIDESGVGQVFVAKQQQQQLSAVPSVANLPHFPDQDLLHDADVDRVCLGNAEVCAEVHKKFVLPEVLRLQACMENSTTRFGLGGLLYYGELGYLQLLNNEVASKVSLKRCVQVIVRYPGLCRYNIWLHYAHSVLHALTIFQCRDDYEALRASYNSARPVGFPPAPPLEGWQGMSDICDHPCCSGQFSASPATGLIGLQENEFLRDFFGCLGFLSLTSESTVRGAMVSIMLAGAAIQHHQEYHRGLHSPSQSSPGLVGDDSGAVRRQVVGESSDAVVDSAWSSALAAADGPAALPRDPSTCALWCAIALGALVRGYPLGQAKSYQYYKIASSIVDALPPLETPRGFRELLKYTGFAWAIETEVASAEDTNSYWKNMPPIWQLSGSVMERDVRGFVLSIVVPLNQPLMDEASAGHLLAKQKQQLSEIAPVGTVPPIENPDLKEAEVDRVCLENAEACAVVQKSVMPEMLRLEDCIESELTYLKLMNKEASMEELKASIQGCVEVVVRYPGLCRYSTWLHYVHVLLEMLAAFRSRQQYETTRVAYNSARPAGALLAPPFEEWRMSDVCEHAFCRGRLSASPATGLIGLQENECLGDFFDCLGFLSLTSESTVRGAMVGVMLAGGWPPHNYHSTAPAMSLVGEEAGAVRQAVGGSNDVTGDSTWSSALAAGSGPGAPPRDQSTCALWCAIALGALVRGSPLDQVGRYVDLAQESLWACYDGATLDTTRAYISMAVLHNILGEQVKSYQYYKLANSIMDELPPQEIPREFRELLKYAGFAWAIETEVASAEDTNSYWTSMPSVWQPLMCEDSARHLLIKQQQLYEAAPVGTVLPIEDLDQLEAEVDRVCLENSEACAEAQKSVMPEVLRLEECIESSTTQFGLGGLLYYGELTYLKLLTKEASLKELKATVQGCVEVIVRYPGLCRYNTWLHYVHILLEILAAFRSRQQYETTRVAYNSVRPAGALPAPPFEEWRMSDVCEHAFCRRLTMRLQSIYSEYLEARSGRPAPE